MITIFIAVLAGIFVAKKQNETLVRKLLSSSSVTDQLRGLTSLSNYSFDALQRAISPILDDKTDASIVAQKLLVQRAFQENRISDLVNCHIDSDLHEAVIWWNTPRERQQQDFLIEMQNATPSSWVMKLYAQYDTTQRAATYQDLIDTPVRDRDGSVLLSVLAIECVAPNKIDSLIRSWERDYDIDRQKAAVLLCALRKLPLPTVSTKNESIVTIQTILDTDNIALAWRTLHQSDGTINPDIALAAMIVDQKKFTQILIDSAMSGKWAHPEHAILLAKNFFPHITNRIPFELLKNQKTRQKWWHLFACGLLKEEG